MYARLLRDRQSPIASTPFSNGSVKVLGCGSRTSLVLDGQPVQATIRKHDPESGKLLLGVHVDSQETYTADVEEVSFNSVRPIVDDIVIAPGAQPTLGTVTAVNGRAVTLSRVWPENGKPVFQLDGSVLQYPTHWTMTLLFRMVCAYRSDMDPSRASAAVFQWCNFWMPDVHDLLSNPDVPAATKRQAIKKITGPGVANLGAITKVGLPTDFRNHLRDVLRHWDEGKDYAST